MKDHRRYIGRKLVDDLLFKRPEFSDDRIQLELVVRIGMWVSEGNIAKRRRRFPDGRCWACWQTGSVHDRFRHDVLLPFELRRYGKRFPTQGPDSLDDGSHGDDQHEPN